MKIYFLVKQEVIPVVFNGISDKYDKISLSNLTHFILKLQSILSNTNTKGADLSVHVEVSVLLKGEFI